MILLASQYTDIPAFYPEWFINRLSQGYYYEVDKRGSGYNKVIISPETVECIVISTKNPKPFMKYLNRLKALGFNFYFRFTLTPYGTDLDKNITNKREILKTFEELAQNVGPERVAWHYGPILLNEKYTIGWHKKSFEQLCRRLSDSTKECYISFDSVKPECCSAYYELPDENEIESIADAFLTISQKYSIELKNCSDDIVTPKIETNTKYVDFDKAERVSSFTIEPKKRNMLSVVDCGKPLTCLHNCAYCQKGEGNKVVMCEYNHENHDSMSPLFIGLPDDTRKVKTFRPQSIIKDEQISMFA